jgi:hypothetical protein
MLTCASTTPRQFPYWICSSALGIVFITIMLYLISQRALLPGVVILGSFILFILWLVGLIVTSVELWGPTGNVNSDCSLMTTYSGPSVYTLAWLEQHSICEFTTPSPFNFPSSLSGVGGNQE